MVLAHHGLDSGNAAFPYVATWSRDRKILQQAMGTIQKISATIIDGVEEQQAAAEGLPPIAGGAPMKRYRGFSEDHGSAMGPEAVFVEDDNGQVTKLKHQVRHSPGRLLVGRAPWYQGLGFPRDAGQVRRNHLWV